MASPTEITVNQLYRLVGLPNAPAIERLQRKRALTGPLAAITAAVVEVIANLALWFGLRVVFSRVTPIEWGLLSLDWPDVASLDAPALAIVALAGAALFGFRLGIIKTLLVCAAAGLALQIGLGW